MKLRILCLAAAALLGSAAARAKDINIIVVSHGQASDPFWSVVKNGATAAGRAEGVTVTYRAPETFDLVAMGQLIQAATSQHPDGIVVSIPDADALGTAIRGAVAAGIPVISMNSGADVSKKLGALLHVGQDEVVAGRAAGEKLAALGGKVALCANQEVGNVGLDQRCRGFAEGFHGRVTVLPVTMDPAETTAKIRAALQSDAALDTVIALGAATVGEPALAAVKAAGAAGRVRVASFDLSPGFLKAVAAGEAAFAIDQQQYLQGFLPVVFLAEYARNGVLPGGDVPSGPNLITKDKAGLAIDLASKGIR